MKSVLIVDDDTDVLDFATATLETSGYKVYRALNATHANDVFEQKSPDLVLLDIMLPGVDGLVALRRMASVVTLDGTRKTKFIMMTARHSREDVAAAIQNGAVDYVVKPLTAGSLLEKVRRHIG